MVHLYSTTSFSSIIVLVLNPLITKERRMVNLGQVYQNFVMSWKVLISNRLGSVISLLDDYKLVVRKLSFQLASGGFNCVYI